MKGDVRNIAKIIAIKILNFMSGKYYCVKRDVT